MQALVLVYINLNIHYATKSNIIEIICCFECLFVVFFFTSYIHHFVNRKLGMKCHWQAGFLNAHKAPSLGCHLYATLLEISASSLIS